MCFSAGASFGASALLGSIGAVTVVKAKTRPQRLFAAIPLLFSVQQLSEGLLWVSLNDVGSPAGQSFFTYTFLVFAMMVWPVWIPFTIRLLEKDAKHKKIMNILLGIGAVVTACLGCVLLFYRVQVVAAGHHLHYEFDFPPVSKFFIGLFTVLYLMATIISPFISGIKRMKWLGFIFLTAYLFSIIFYNGFVISVWCYFAATLSVVVFWIIWGLRKGMS